MKGEQFPKNLLWGYTVCGFTKTRHETERNTPTQLAVREGTCREINLQKEIKSKRGVGRIRACEGGTPGQNPVDVYTRSRQKVPEAHKRSFE